MYNNCVEYLREAGDWKENLQENIGSITAERDPFEDIVTLPRFEQESST